MLVRTHKQQVFAARVEWSALEQDHRCKSFSLHARHPGPHPVPPARHGIEQFYPLHSGSIARRCIDEFQGACSSLDKFALPATSVRALRANQHGGRNTLQAQSGLSCDDGHYQRGKVVLHKRSAPAVNPISRVNLKSWQLRVFSPGASALPPHSATVAVVLMAVELATMTMAIIVRPNHLCEGQKRICVLQQPRKPTRCSAASSHSPVWPAPRHTAAALVVELQLIRAILASHSGPPAQSPPASELANRAYSKLGRQALQPPGPFPAMSRPTDWRPRFAQWVLRSGQFRVSDTKTSKARLRPPDSAQLHSLSILTPPPLPLRNAFFNALCATSGMGSANPRLLKTLLSWLRRSVGIPLTLLVLYLEVYPSSVILHRLSRRLRRSSFSFACILKKRDHANLSDQNDNNDIFFVGGADVMDRAQSHSRSQHKPTSKTHSRKRPLTLNHRAGSGGSPISYRPQQPLASASLTSPSPTTTPTTSATTNSAIIATTVTTPAVARATDTSPPASAPTSPSPTTTPTTTTSSSTSSTSSATTNTATIATSVTTPAVARAADASPPASAPLANPQLLHRRSPSTVPSTVTTPAIPRAANASSPAPAPLPNPKSPQRPAPSTVPSTITTPAIARAASASPPASAALPKPQPLPRPSPSTVPSTTTTPAIARAANASPPASAALSSPKPLQRPSASTVPSTPTPTTMRSHTRSMSHADVTKQSKRLSLQFPIQPSAGSNSPVFSPRSRPQSWVAAPSPSHSADNSGLNTPSSPETNILAILAAQERYVMELKEELAKAEGDLKILKTHYATHQAMKQRNEGRKITQLQPLNTSLVNFQEEAHHDDDDGSTLWMQREMERRKALMNSTKSSQRKTFSGSRHLRTLSLLSPDKSYTPSFPQPLDIRGDDSTNSDNNNDKINNTQLVPPLIRHATSPDIASHIASLPNNERYDLGGLPNIQRDAILRTGKQMATDLRDGLMTFIEDIRQATVGEEAINDNSAHGGARGPAAKPGRKPSDGRPTLNRATSSKKSTTQKTGDIGDDFWKEHGLSEPTAVPTNKKTHPLKNIHTPQKQSQTNPDDFEDWANWDTPNDKYLANNSEINNGSSSDESDAPSSPVSGPSSSRTSTRYHSQRHDSKASSLTTSSSVGNIDEISSRDQKRSSIPWPDLVKLSPNNLKRTASHLMKEWEKQLTPPPEARDASHSSGDYVGRSASPVP